MPGGRPGRGRGGKRQGNPGTPHPQRTDLQTASPPVQSPKAQTGQQYGSAQAQLQAQAVVPLPATPAFQARRGADGRISGLDRVDPAAAAAQAGPPGIAPGELQHGLDTPTAEPATPLTAGLPTGAGPGPSALGLDDGSSDVKMQVQALFRQYPLGDIADLLAEMG